MSETSSNNSLSDDDILDHQDNLELEGEIINKYNIISVNKN